MVIIVVLALFLTEIPLPGFANLAGAAVWLPVMLLAATVNAASEELLYGHALIGTAEAMGPGAALALSSLVFGLAHVTGNPGGPAGVAYTAGYGAVCGWAMLRTRGYGWNLAMHVFGDLAIVLTMTLAGTQTA